MTGGLAEAAPHRPDRSPEGIVPPGRGGRWASVRVVIRTAGM